MCGFCYDKFIGDFKGITPNSDTYKTPTYNEIVRRLSAGDRDYIVDPAENILTMTQTLCVGGMDAELSQISSALNMITSCMEAINYTGEGDTEVCKDVFSSYVCDVLYDVVKCGSYLIAGRPQYSQGFGNIPVLKTHNLMSALYAGINAASKRVYDKYGTSNMYKALFGEKRFVHSLCLMMFGLDVPSALSGMFDVESAKTSVAPLVYVIPSSTYRRFKTFDLTTGVPTYEYHVGYFITAGSDVRYKVRLICSDGYDCDGDACDCSYSGEKSIIIKAGQLKQGEDVQNVAIIQRADNTRYDEAEIDYSWKNNKGEWVNGEPVVIKVADKGGTPSFCNFDINKLAFLCLLEPEEPAPAHIKSLVVSPQNPKIGDSIRFNYEIINPGEASFGESGTVYLETQLIRQSDNKIIYVSQKQPIQPSDTVIPWVESYTIKPQDVSSTSLSVTSNDATMNYTTTKAVNTFTFKITFDKDDSRSFKLKKINNKPCDGSCTGNNNCCKKDDDKYTYTTETYTIEYKNKELTYTQKGDKLLDMTIKDIQFNNGNSATFTIKMSPLPANTPFIVKSTLYKSDSNGFPTNDLVEAQPPYTNPKTTTIIVGRE